MFGHVRICSVQAGCPFLLMQLGRLEWSLSAFGTGYHLWLLCTNKPCWWLWQTLKGSTTGCFSFFPSYFSVGCPQRQPSPEGAFWIDQFIASLRSCSFFWQLWALNMCYTICLNLNFDLILYLQRSCRNRELPNFLPSPCFPQCSPII